MHVEDVLETDFVRLRGERRTAAHRRQPPLQHFDPAAVSSAGAARRDRRHAFHAAKGGRGSHGRASRRPGLWALDRHARRGSRGRTPVRRRARRVQAAAQSWSAVVRLRPTAQPRFDIGSEGALRTLVTAAFSHRRKTLRNSAERPARRAGDRILRDRSAIAPGDAGAGAIRAPAAPPITRGLVGYT